MNIHFAGEPIVEKPIIEINQENFKKNVAHLPFIVRKAFSLLLNLQKGMLDFHMPDHRIYRFKSKDPSHHGIIEIKSYNVAKRFLKNGEVGFAESYLANEWESPDVSNFLEVFCMNQSVVINAINKRPFSKLWLRFFHWMNKNTKKGSRKNIAAHYDLGNDFYSKWLDSSMTYSSALFEKGANSIECAQHAKYKNLADKTEIQAGDQVLEIGCGWGGFAEYLAKERDVHVTALTISQEQYAFANARIEKAGLTEKVTLKLQDYRDETGTYDKIVSVEMFEAVGEEYWATFFQTLHNSLKPGGKAGLQIITIQDQFFDHYRRTTDFIQRYIFPGGMLPSPSRLKELSLKNNLSLSSEHIFGQDYARTLAEWNNRFHASWPKLIHMGFDDTFKRMWSYYLHYCEAGFRAGNIDVRQIVYQRKSS